MPKKMHMSDETFSELRKSLGEVVAHASGKRADLRTTKLMIAAPPDPMSATAVASLRKSLDCSQAMFAKALNVSAATVRGWEQGLRTPSHGSLRLLEIVKKNPGVMFVRQQKGEHRRPATKGNEHE